MITLTQRAHQRLMVLNALERAEATVEAATLLGCSTRHARRLRADYRVRGPAAVVHGNRGRPSSQRLDDALRTQVVTLAKTTYAGANHLHLQELLAEREGLHISYTSLRRILRDAGLHSPKRRRARRHRRRRERMPREGMLLQVDGSVHDWLEGRGPWLTLLAIVDDATGAVLAGEFREAEDAHGHLRLFQHVAHRHGLPLAVYSDRHGIFHRDKRTPPTLAEQLAGGPAPTQVGRMLHELGIRWIPASSPQAKGRIENRFGTFQDRLVTELRLAGITDCKGANAFLPGFFARYNARFAQPAAHPEPAYRPWPAGLDPKTVFCFKYQRRVANDNTVTVGARRLQILPGPHDRSYAQVRVDVHERLDGTLAVWYQGQRLATHLITPAAPGRIPARAHRRVRPAPPTTSPESLRGGIQISPRSSKTRPGASERAQPSMRGVNIAQRQPWRPPADHPWRQAAGEAKRRSELRKAGVTFSRNN
jgi:transposase